MNFTKELAFEIVSNPKIAPFLHLPVQSGSNAVLKRMLREYTIEEYLERLAYLGSGRSQLCLSTDFIVGFPGESEQDFQKTLDLLDVVRFETSFSFIYSLRPGTSAVRLKDDLPAEVKQERLLRLQSRQAHWTLLDNQKMIGKIVNARIENPILNDEGFWIARTGSSKTVHLQGKLDRRPEMGQLISAKITGASPHFLAAELI
jgi:tRNA-2-methylthio-N6-dimethylallyladenosine synthase